MLDDSRSALLRCFLGGCSLQRLWQIKVNYTIHNLLEKLVADVTFMGYLAISAIAGQSFMACSGVNSIML